MSRGECVAQPGCEGLPGREAAVRARGRWARAVSWLAMLVLLFTHLAHTGGGSAHDRPETPAQESRLWTGPFLKLFRGPHIPKKLSEITLTDTFNWVQTEDRIGVFATGTKIRDYLAGALTVEWEALYADHWGSSEFNEIAAALYARWNRFPWNDYMRTTLAIGMGPSITSQPAHYEPRGGIKSLWLMQLNFEINIYSPADPGWALLFRIQHRSGLYEVINGVRGGSNFLTIGLRRQF